MAIDQTEDGWKDEAAESDESQTLFLEDTVEIQVDGHPLTGLVFKTWHDIDEQDSWEEIDNAIAGAKATSRDLQKLKETGLLSRGFILFTPSLPEYPPMVIHESECKLLDRSLAFGDVVKKSLTSPQSGTVISVETTVSMEHSFRVAPLPTDTGPRVSKINDVAESDLKLANEWNEGDFIIYKNCWMGVVDEIFEDIAVKLSNESVVIVDDPFELDIYISSGGGEAEIEKTSDTAEQSDTTQNATIQTKRPKIDKSIEPPSHLAVGMQITTTKANLRRGRWLYGAYDPEIPPTGVIVTIDAVRLGVHWLCQNIMVPGKFIPVPQPDNWINLLEESEKIRRFYKSSSGFVKVNGDPLSDRNNCTAGGELQVGDRVRFQSRDTMEKYLSGNNLEIPRTDTMGFDINVYLINGTKTKIRVLWQDTKETVHDACALVPYLNVDEHEVWPGEIVVVKPEPNNTMKKTFGDVIREHGEPETSAIAPALWGTSQEISTEVPIEFLRPEKVGVVQRVDPVGRVADVRWYTSPKVELAAGIMIPGSRTGELEEMAEEVSFYEAVAHQALGVRRGDYVLIQAEHVPNEDQPALQDTPAPNTGLPAENNTLPHTLAQGPAESNHLTQIVENIRGMVDSSLLANLSAALGSHSNPQFQSINRALNQFPALYNGTRPPSSPLLPAGDLVNPYINNPPDWIGEVVDLGLDGLITVRLGALENPRDIRVSIDRVHVIFNEEMDLGDSEGYEDDMSSDDDMSESSDELEILEETITYHGGERLDNGGDEDWLTDEDDDDSMDFDDMENILKLENSQNTGEPIPRTPPPIPENVPAPEAISLPLNSRTPPRFLVLDSPIPTDHAFGSRPAATVSQAFSRRIARENKILSSSLPEGIFVRTWESRLDLLRVLIVGPLNTPYELAPFLFDFYFPPTFPAEPPLGHFHSWTNGIGRVNPNLYEEGKICISLLGTWHAENRGEGWVSSKSSVLQILVSLMGLVLVREPWYNEAGFTVYEGSKDSSLSSQLYSEKAFILARGFVQHVLQHPIKGFEDIINWIYLPSQSDESESSFQPGPQLLKAVIKKAKDVISRSESKQKITPNETADGVGRVSQGALVLLRKNLKTLEAILEAKEQK